MFASVLSRLSAIRESYVLRSSLRRELSAITSTEALGDREAAVSRCEAVEGDWQTQEMRRALANHRTLLTR
jgi:hypothetical protein